MFLFIKYRISALTNFASHLNTSHVLIYRREVLEYMELIAFKYISCSYLSSKAEAEKMKKI